MHLVWWYGKIRIHPLPEYIVCQDLWPWKLEAWGDKTRDDFEKAALGLLSTYSSLIKHKSDYDIALEKKLISERSIGNSFGMFTRQFKEIEDTKLSTRYRHYGEIRLTRLNLFSRFFGLGPFQRPNPQYSEYYQRFYAPILFIVGFISVVQSSTQAY